MDLKKNTDGDTGLPFMIALAPLIDNTAQDNWPKYKSKYINHQAHSLI